MKNYTQNALISGLLRVLSILPYGLVARLGEALGSLLYRIPGNRKHILHTNLRLCFPEQTDDQRDHLAHSPFRHVIRSYMQRGIQWYGSAKALTRVVEINSAIDMRDKIGSA